MRHGRYGSVMGNWKATGQNSPTELHAQVSRIELTRDDVVLGVVLENSMGARSDEVLVGSEDGAANAAQSRTDPIRGVWFLPRRSQSDGR